MTRLGFALVVLAVSASGYLAVLYFAQRSLLFPAPMVRSLPTPGRAEIVRFAVSGGEAMALFLAPSNRSSGPAPLLLFTHGNAELADDWVPVFEEVITWGWAALLLEYPGYGRASGAPSERSINAAASAAYAWAQRDSRIDAKRIVPYGRSIGGGPAARLAADQQAPALILESSLTSVRAFAARFLAPPFLVRDPFDNLEALRSYRGPLLVVHGNRDDIVPIAHGRALAAAVPGAEFLEVPCGHNDCPRPWSLIKTFLQKSGLM